MVEMRSKDAALIVIESDIIEDSINTIEKILDEEGIEECSAQLISQEAADLYSDQVNQSLLGEEVRVIKKEIRPVYFGLKNIILKDIEVHDKDINTAQFFVDEETPGMIPIERSYRSLKSAAENEMTSAQNNED